MRSAAPGGRAGLAVQAAGGRLTEDEVEWRSSCSSSTGRGSPGPSCSSLACSSSCWACSLAWLHSATCSPCSASCSTCFLPSSCTLRAGAGGWVWGERGSACSWLPAVRQAGRTEEREGQEAAVGGPHSPLPGVGGLLLSPELVLQLSDHLLPAEHCLSGHGQFFCH